MKNEYTKDQLEEYLLGKGSEEERAALAEALLLDGELHARMQELECDRIDALARGELRGAEAAVWREFVEQSGQLDRLRFAGALAEKTRPRRRALWWLEVAAAVLLVGGGAWWWMGIERKPVAVLEARRVSLVLPRDVTRAAGGGLELRIAKSVEEVELQFEVGAEPASGYRVRVLDARGSEVAVREGSGWPASPLRLRVAARELPQGLVRLELIAIDGAGRATPVGFHEVRVVKIDE